MRIQILILGCKGLSEKNLPELSKGLTHHRLKHVYNIDLVTVSEPILTTSIKKQPREKLQCLYENLIISVKRLF